MRYSIEDTTLTALADATRKAAGAENVVVHKISAASPGISGYKDAYNFTFNGESTDWGGTNAWYYKVIEFPEGATEWEILGRIEVNLGYNEIFFIAEGDQQVPNPENVLYQAEAQGSITIDSGIKGPFITTAKAITIGAYCGAFATTPAYYFDITGYGPQKFTPEEMATTVGGLKALVPELLNLSGDISYKFYNGAWDSFITAYANDIVAKQVISLNNTFNNTKLERIPFEITGKAGFVTSLKSMCQKSKLKEPPVLKYMKPQDIDSIFDDCYYLREFPEGYGEDWDWSWHTSQTGGYNAARNGMFDNCYSLRQLPLALLKYTNPNLNYSYHLFREMNNLYVLDKATNLPCSITTAVNGTGYSGIFYNMFVKWCRCRSLTFADDIGPMKWAKQVIDLSQNFGWASSTSVILGYNSGITADKQVTDEASYIALRNDPDWFSTDVGYSRYNLASAISTINSLPDCSEYAAANGTNIIKFKGDAGSKTATTWVGDTPMNSAAIKNLTDEHIAVAAAKGWTVAFA